MSAEGAKFALALATGVASYPSMQIIRAPEYRGGEEAVERAEYALSLLPREEQDAAFAETPWTAKDVQSVIMANSSLKVVDDDYFAIDGELVFEIDKRVRAPMYITSGSKVYSEEQLLATFPFAELGVCPRSVFAQQELGVFPARGMDPSAREYEVRDLGSEGAFVTIEDLVGRSARVNYKDKRPIITTVKTKVFLARGGWTDFQNLAAQMRMYARFGQMAAARAAREGRPNFLSIMVGGLARAAQPALEDASQAEERVRRAALELEERERRLAERERRLAQQTEELLAKLADL